MKCDVLITVLFLSYFAFIIMMSGSFHIELEVSELWPDTGTINVELHLQD
jgi:hypothetical protein